MDAFTESCVDRIKLDSRPTLMQLMDMEAALRSLGADSDADVILDIINRLEFWQDL